MRQMTFILLFCFCTIQVTSQVKTTEAKQIDDLAAIIDVNSIELKSLFVDSSNKEREPFKEYFYIDKSTKQLSKVQFILIKSDVKMTYYFLNNALCKVYAIDKSTDATFFIETYFRNGKLIFQNHKTVDGDNSGKWLLKRAKSYLLRIASYNREN